MAYSVSIEQAHTLVVLINHSAMSSRAHSALSSDHPCIICTAYLLGGGLDLTPFASFVELSLCASLLLCCLVGL